MSDLSLSQSLSFMSELLSDLSCPWALVGGLAISTRCEPRFTHDLDLAISVKTDEEAESLTFKLIRRGARLMFTLDQDVHQRLSMVSLCFDQIGQNPIDLLFASSGIESEIIDAAEDLEIFQGVIVPVATLGHLTALKLLSVSTSRMKDLSDLSALRAVMTEADQNIAREACQLIVKRDYHRGLDLLARFDLWAAGEIPIK